MYIRLLSDLHHEFYEDAALYESKGEDVLVIAGDLAVGFDAVWYALRQFSKNAKHVVYVPGNHEYYHTEIPAFDDKIRRFSAGTNIHFLNPGLVTIEGVHFIGANLWTDFQQDAMAKVYCARVISDFSLIRGFSTQQAVDLNAKAKAYFEGFERLYVEGKKVYVTHFLPTRACIAPEYKNAGTINKYFANTMEEFIDRSQPDLWLFGHTHSNVDIYQGKTNLIANPYGYNKNFKYQEKLICL